MSKPSKKITKAQSEKIAKKITAVFNLIQGLTQEDIDYLTATAKIISDENSTLQTIGGLLVDYDKAETKQKLGKQAQNRIQGLVMIWNALKETPKIQFNQLKHNLKKQHIDKMFGL